MGIDSLSTHHTAFSTLTYVRLLCGHRGCPLRTLYGIDIISLFAIIVNIINYLSHSKARFNLLKDSSLPKISAISTDPPGVTL